MNEASRKDTADNTTISELAEKLYKQKENVKGEQDRAELSGGSFFLGLYYLDLTI